MASVNFEKIKSPTKLKALLRHCDQTERTRTKEHSNEHLNKALTHLNAQMDRSYQDVCKMYDERMAYLDSLQGANKRKDRVVAFMLEIPLPNGLDDPQSQNKWVSNTVAILSTLYGSENVLQAYVHRDEQHEYIDGETGESKVSRVHIHVPVIPEHDGKLNGKWFSSRRNINFVNAEIHKMTQQEFGLDFMDGTKRKSKSDVETLKAKSKAKELEVRADEVAQREQEADAILTGCKNWQANLTEQEKALEQEQEENNDTFMMCQEWQRTLLARQNELEEREKKLEQEKQAYKRIVRSSVKAELTEQANKQVDEFCDKFKETMSRRYRAFMVRPLPQYIKDDIEQEKDKFTLTF